MPEPVSSVVEVLESRIAPAILYMGPDGSIRDQGGQMVANDAANLVVDASKAVLLKTGDSLVFDADDNLVFGKDLEPILFTVKKGAAVVFLDDLPGGLPLEIGGVAVTSAFSGSTQVDLHGDLATVLETVGKGKATTYSLSVDAGGFLQLVPGSGIAGFSASGAVEGSIVASGSLSKITLNGVVGGRSVDGLYAGTGSSGLATLDLGGTQPVALADFTPSGAGGSINGVTTAGGIQELKSGYGADAESKPGAGGSISKIVIGDQGGLDLTVVTGSGGSASGDKSAAGAAGGSIRDLRVEGVTGNLTVETGDGGAGSYSGAGGAAGGIVTLSARISGNASISTGDGGAAGTPYSGYAVNKAGGAGGSVDKLTLESVGGGAAVEMLLGNSGDGGGKVSGGGVRSATFGGDAFASVALTAGNGGASTQGAPGAAGGSLHGLTLASRITGTLTLISGDGGDGGLLYDAKGNVKTFGAGGDGGQITSIPGGIELGGLYLKTGNGGSGAGIGTAGVAFGFDDIGVSLSDGADVTIATGNGGDGSKRVTPGGSVRDVTLTAVGPEERLGAISVVTGEGGAAGAITKTGGSAYAPSTSTVAKSAGAAGGDIRALTIESKITAVVMLSTGSGGDASDAHSEKMTGAGRFTLLDVMDGGRGGDVTDLRISGVTGDIEIATGNGASGGTQPYAGLYIYGSPDAGFRQKSLKGNGGNGGAIDGVTANIFGNVLLTTGYGGQAGNLLTKKNESPQGGEGGDISRITIQGVAVPGGADILGTVSAAAGGGGVGYGAVARKGGSFDEIQLTGSLWTVELTAGDGAQGARLTQAVSGGAVNLLVENGGGAGGTFDGILFAADIGDLVITGGNGGAAADDSAKPGGNGAELSGLVITGTLGNARFTSGTGGDGTSGSGGSAGEISNLDLTHSGTVEFEPGTHGLSADSVAAGRAGASVSDIVFRAVGTDAAVMATGGSGSNGLTSGGEGGALSGLTFASGTFAWVELGGGSGGDAGPNGNGGNGGALSSIDVATGVVIDELSIQGGTGGAGGATGGEGAEVTGGSFGFDGTLRLLKVLGGTGGGGGRGGAGGDVSGFNEAVTDAEFTGGDAGQSLGTFDGASGGSVEGITLRLEGSAVFTPGLSGDSGPDGGDAAEGASVRFLNLTATSATAQVEISGGDGATGHGASGGAGSVSNITLAGGTFASVSLVSGNGGPSKEGGVVSEVSVAASAAVVSFTMASGDGGAAVAGSGLNGGAGGALDGTSHLLLGSIGSFTGLAGNGGAGDGGGMGGEGGDVMHLAFTMPVGTLVLEAGTGGGGAHGGRGGSVTDVSAAVTTEVSIQSGTGGVGGAGGGDISAVTLALNANASASLVAGDASVAPTGPAAAGGAISDVLFSSAVPNTLVAAIFAQAGRGGSGGADGINGGEGGSITGIEMSNLIAQTLDILAGDGGDGGLDANGGAGGDLIDILARVVASYNVSAGFGGLGDGAGSDGADGVEVDVVVAV